MRANRSAVSGPISRIISSGLPRLSPSSRRPRRSPRTPSRRPRRSAAESRRPAAAERFSNAAGDVDHLGSRPATCRRCGPAPPGRCWRCRRRRSACRPWPSRLSSTVSLVDTFEPATIATSGRFGFSSAVSSAISSFISSGPAQATLAHTAPRRACWPRRDAPCRRRPSRRRRTARPCLLRQLVLVLLLALVEAHVLEQHDLARRALDAVEPVAARSAP